MRKKRCFLVFLTSLCLAFFTAGAMAAGYICPDLKQYTSCNTGYYLNSAEIGNACVLCSTAANRTSTQSCTRTCTTTELTNLHATAGTVSGATQTCAGNFQTGTGGETVGTGSCSGCSTWGTCGGGTCAATSCVAGYYFGSNTCSACSALNNTAVLSNTTITGGGTRTNKCTGKYTGGAGGTKGSSECTGCSASTWSCTCPAGFHAVNQGTSTCNCEADTVSVSYNLNGGAGTTPTATTCTLNASCTLQSGDTTSFYRAGYVFTGWSTSTTGTGSSSGTFSANTTVYAIWTPCGTGKYKGAGTKAAAACSACPVAYPNTTATTSTLITQCYSGTKKRSSTGAHLEKLPQGCKSATYTDCTPATCDYVAYSNSAGTGDGELKSGCATNTNTCDKPVKTVIADVNHWASSTATSCTACDASYPYSPAGTTAAGKCYRNCTTADVNGATAVSGTVLQEGTRSCRATTCDSSHCIASGGVCMTKPTYGTCSGNPDNPLTCNTGYELSADKLNCEAKTFTVSYSCGDGTGTKPSNANIKYNQSFTPANNTCTRASWQFGGWTVSGTSDVKQAGAAFKWLYTENKTFTAKWIQTAGNCTAGQYYNGTVCQSCPSGYTSNAGATAQSDCYKDSTTACTNPGVNKNCPSNANACDYDTSVKVPCRQQYGSSTCTPTGTATCPIKTGSVSCNANYYQDSDNCLSCADLGGNYTYSGGGDGGSEICYEKCKFACDASLLCPANATCTNVSDTINGGKFYPSKTCTPFAGNTCQITFTCNTGYSKNNNSCQANVYAITLDDNGGSGGSGTVYEKYNTGWSLTNFGTTVSKVRIPTRSNYTFLGYFEARTGGTAVIAANGTLPANTKYVSTKTLYAQWSQDNFYCTAGKSASGAACAAGSYCPGGTVPAGTENNTTTGCQRTCPADAKGGNVSSPTGATSRDQCSATRTNYSDASMHGRANQTCLYGTSEYNRSCTIEITSCEAGYYRASEADTTCTSTDIGTYSPANDLRAYSCRDLNGANATTTTENRNAAAATQCYNTCSNIKIDNGTRVPENSKEYYTGTTIPACRYTTQCTTGYQASGDTCVPSVYKITLNHDGGTSATAEIFLKYNTGWYSDSAATRVLTSIVLPTKPGGFTCYGYTYGNTIVVDQDGALTSDYKLFTAPATIRANWEQNPQITCAAGTYYTGTGTTCTKCPAGSYCTGTTTFQDIGTSTGIATCASLNGTYTSAVNASGQTLTTEIGSNAGATGPGLCFATNVAYRPASNSGTGKQTCYYNTSTRSYIANCESQQILTCVEGYYLARNTDTDCSVAGHGYYSAAKTLERTACPNLGETAGVTTKSETSGDITKCYLGNIWYEPAGGHSGHRRSCYHINDASITDVSAGYSYNCDVSVIVSCDAGYYDNGAYKNDNGERDCIAVEKNYYSPEQAFYTPGNDRPDQNNPGMSTKRYACPDSGLTDTRYGARDSECYKQCREIAIDNGTGIVPVGMEKVFYENTAYPVCLYTAQCDEGFTPASTEPTANPSCGVCPENHYCGDGGTQNSCPASHPYSDAGATDRSACYKNCELAQNAQEMSGREYANGTSTCKITACVAGTYLTGDRCVACPAGKICTGGTTPPTDCPENSYCPSGSDEPMACPAEFPLSAANTTSISACYRNCTIDDVENSDSVSGTITQAGVNTCVATSCKPGAYMTGQHCTICPAGSICDGGITPPTDCPADSYCPSGSSDPIACPATHPNSPAGTTDAHGCYQTCEEYALDGGTAIPDADKAFWEKVCQYHGISDTENPCEIIGDRCVEKSCHSNFELIDGKCRLCNRENVMSYKPTGNCIPQTCVLGWHPSGLYCEEDVRECTAPNATYAEQTWNPKLGAFGICTVRECDAGYHLASNACVPDEQACTVENGVGIREWDQVANKWGACQATSCNPGYTNDPSETNEHSKPCGQCKNKFSVLGEQAASSYVRGCEIASCMYQGEIYNLDNNECVPICIDDSDDTGTIRRVGNKCIRTCNEGYTAW